MYSVKNLNTYGRLVIIYTVSHFNQRMGISLKVSILEKNFPYKSYRVQRGQTYGDLDLDLEVKDQGHFNVTLIFVNENLIFSLRK